MVMPARRAHSRLQEMAKAGRTEAAFVARQEREPAHLARARAFEAKEARTEQLFRDVRIAR